LSISIKQQHLKHTAKLTNDKTLYKLPTTICQYVV